MLAFALGLIPSMTSLRRWGVPILIAALSAAACWFALRAQTWASTARAAQVQLVDQTTKRKAAEATLKAEREAATRADQAAEADQTRVRDLEASLERQKGIIDALERKYGATPVSPLTREYLARMRDRQRAR